MPCFVMTGKRKIEFSHSLAFLGFTFTLHTTSGAYRACPSSIFTISQQPFDTRRSGRHTPFVAVVRG